MGIISQQMETLRQRIQRIHPNHPKKKGQHFSGATLRIIPFSKWLLTMVMVSHQWYTSFTVDALNRLQMPFSVWPSIILNLIIFHLPRPHLVCKLAQTQHPVVKIIDEMD